MHHGISLARVSPIPPVTGMAVTVLDSVFTKIVIVIYHSIYKIGSHLFHHHHLLLVLLSSWTQHSSLKLIIIYKSILEPRVSPVPLSSLLTGVAVIVFDPALITKIVILLYQNLEARISPIPPSSLVTGVVFTVLGPSFVAKLLHAQSCKKFKSSFTNSFTNTSH